MSERFELLIHLLFSLVRLLKPGGVKVVMAETMIMKQQLIVMNRGKRRTPNLTTSDRFLFGFLAFIIDEKRLEKLAVVIKPETILAIHKALVKKNTVGYTQIRPEGFQVESHKIKQLLVLLSRCKSAIRLSAIAVFQCRYSKLSGLPSAASQLAEY